MSEVYSSGSWKAKEGEEKEFVEAWTEFARWLSTMPGAGPARLTEDMSEPGRYLSFAPWESAEAMQAWKSDPAFKEYMGPVQEHVAEFTPSEWKLVAQS
ncbi:MAG TPA: antibiotic biosynthesis monooxygenase family protein [Solirubrobacterales bacterium]|jgi:heme-degrading monooxygenase HmoA